MLGTTSCNVRFKALKVLYMLFKRPLLALFHIYIQQNNNINKKQENATVGDAGVGVGVWVCGCVCVWVCGCVCGRGRVGR